MTKLVFRIFSLFVLIFSLFGCNPVKKSVTPTSAVIPLPPQWTETPPPVIKIPSTIQPTSTVVSSPTFTPYPLQTISADQASSIFSLLNLNSACSLPCWNDLSPGLSTSLDIHGFFARLGFEFTYEILEEGLGIQSSSRYVIPNYPDAYSYNVEVVMSDKDVIRIELFFTEIPPILHPISITNALGGPEDVFLSVESAEGPPIYTIILDYPSLNTAFIYSGWTTIRPGINVCLNRSEDVFSGVQLYSSEFDATTLVRYPPGEFLSPEEIADISTIKFIDDLTNPNSCIRLSESELW